MPPQNISLDNLSQRIDPSLWQAFQDIAANVQIQDGFCIRHPHYKPWELAPEALTRLQSMSTDSQQKYLKSQLRSFLYGLYYNGSFKTLLAPESEVNLNPQDLENNTFLGMDIAFYEQLHASNTGEGYFDPDWVILREESDGAIAVSKGGLTLHIQRDQHLTSANEAIAIGRPLAIKLPKNLVQNGFYMAVGNAGLHESEAAQSQLVRVYWNLTPPGAIAVMKSLTQKLNALSLPFSFKVLFNPADYTRHDSGVLYFNRNSYSQIQPILNSVHTEQQAHFKNEIPLFTKKLNVGLGLAEEPIQKLSATESFGMNRCQIIANGLINAIKTDPNSMEHRLSSILTEFSLMGIDIERPYLNPDSTDIF